MSAQRISNYDARKVARILSKPLELEKRSVIDFLTNCVATALLDKLPSNVVEFHKSHPEYVKEIGGVYLYDKASSYSLHVYPKVLAYPSGLSVDAALKANQVVQDSLPVVLPQIKQLQKDCDSFVSKTVGLKSYVRIKKDFPEAYEVLISQVGRSFDEPVLVAKADETLSFLRETLASHSSE